MAVLCPQPRRAFAPPPVATEKKNPSLPNSPGYGADEAQNELRELLGSSTEPRQLLLAGRPLSSASTSAGPTPCPEERVSSPPWSSPGGYGIAYDDDGAPSSPSPPLPQVLQTPQEFEGVKEAPILPSQVRKVFVGGIPQSMNQDELYTIFSEFAGVKKAWLQLHRAGALTAGPPRNHRGFGFVIFHDGSAVEKFLGKNNNRFLVLADGRKLEVKRAVSSSDMDGNENQVKSNQQPKNTTNQAPLPTGERWQRGQSQSGHSIQSIQGTQGAQSGQGGQSSQGQGSQVRRTEVPGSSTPPPWLNSHAPRAPVPLQSPPPTPTPHQQGNSTPFYGSAIAIQAPNGGASSMGMTNVISQAPNGGGASSMGMTTVISQAPYAPVPALYVAASPAMVAVSRAHSEAAQMMQVGAQGQMAALPQLPQFPHFGGSSVGPMATTAQDVNAALAQRHRQWLANMAPQSAMHFMMGQDGSAVAVPWRTLQPPPAATLEHATGAWTAGSRPAALLDAEAMQRGSALSGLPRTEQPNGGGGGPARMMLPANVESNKENKELEHMLLQAMPDHYDD